MTLENYLKQREEFELQLFSFFLVTAGFLFFIFLKKSEELGFGLPERTLAAIFVVILLGLIFYRFILINRMTKRVLGREKITTLLYECPDKWQETLLGFEKERLPVEEVLMAFDTKSKNGGNRKYFYTAYLVEEHARLTERLSTFKYSHNDRHDCESVLQDLEDTPSWKTMLLIMQINEVREM